MLHVELGGHNIPKLRLSPERGILLQFAEKTGRNGAGAPEWLGGLETLSIVVKACFFCLLGLLRSFRPECSLGFVGALEENVGSVWVRALDSDRDRDNEGLRGGLILTMAWAMEPFTSSPAPEELPLSEPKAVLGSSDFCERIG